MQEMKNILLLLILTTLCSCAQTTKNDAPLNKNLVAWANEVNKSCPRKLEERIQLDSVSVLPGDILQFNHTLKDKANIKDDTVAIKMSLTARRINSLQTDSDMSYFRYNRI